VKVRIGISTGVAPSGGAAAFGRFVDDIDGLGFDSLWMPEVLTAPTLDPLVGLAKELATLDGLSDGRLLITFVPGLSRPTETAAVGVPAPSKGDVMDETIPLLRALWAGETVSHDGASGHFDEVTLAPLPVQQPLEMWTGGMVPAALRRCGRLADGWLPSSCEEVVAARRVIDESAEAAGRIISPEHFGVSLAYAARPLDARLKKLLASTRRGVDLEQVVPVGLTGLRAMLERFLEVGFSKFVVRPIETPDSWRAELEALADGVLDLQT
jgi:alkanesulfonate monooxygenase SsuD/methylene tetrahydromethanopterin reductase-like flavin-dependent oxidoreductase (luciferase family)